jgi:hypothetical protein
LEFPCIYAGLQDFQLAFSGFRMAFPVPDFLPDVAILG